MKVSLGVSLGDESAKNTRDCEGIRAMFLYPDQKAQTNFLTALKVWVSPPPISVITTQTALAVRGSTIHRSPPPSQDLGAKREKQPLWWLSRGDITRIPRGVTVAPQKDMCPLPTFFKRWLPTSHEQAPAINPVLVCATCRRRYNTIRHRWILAKLSDKVT